MLVYVNPTQGYVEAVYKRLADLNMFASSMTVNDSTDMPVISAIGRAALTAYSAIELFQNGSCRNISWSCPLSHD